MRYEFEKPVVPNFIRVRSGETTIALALSQFDEEEITEYCELWCETLAKRRAEQLTQSDQNTDFEKVI